MKVVKKMRMLFVNFSNTIPGTFIGMFPLRSVLSWHDVIPWKPLYEMSSIIFLSFEKFISFCWRLETHCQERNLRHFSWSFWFTFFSLLNRNHYLFHILFRVYFFYYFESLHIQFAYKKSFLFCLQAICPKILNSHWQKRKTFFLLYLEPHSSGIPANAKKNI